VVSNDSEDATSQILDLWTAENPAVRTHIKLDGMTTKLPSRTDRLPICRNALLEELRRKPTDIMVMMDMDDLVTHPFSTAGILSCFKHPVDSWAVMAGNMAGEYYGTNYYDIWALRSDWCPYDCWGSVSVRPSTMTYDAAVENYIKAHQRRRIPPNAEPIEVKSAFCGMAVYQVRHLENCSYSKESSYGKNDVEHVAFHEGIRRNGGKVFINPALIIR
jgi:hypothetical protein